MDDELVIRQFRRRYSRSVFGLSEINGSIGLETAMNNHPGFGTFAKMHHEFFNALSDDGWRKLDGYEGVSEKSLSGEFNHDACTGSVTRLSRWVAGAHVGDTISHAWCEEVFLISGSLSIGVPGEEEQRLTAGSYAVRPANIPHGPFFSEEGCLMIEFSYYPPKAPMHSSDD